MDTLNVGLFFSEKCNLNCNYCYYNKDFICKSIEDFIKSGDFIDRLSELNLEFTSLSLWGAEPSYNLDYLSNYLNILLKKFPKLDTILFSTNLTKVEKIIQFIETLNKVDLAKGRVNLDIQFSIDGDEYNTDLNRGRGTHQKVLKGLEILYNFLENIDLSIKNIKLRNKVTFNINNIKYFVETSNSMQEYLCFFDMLSKRYKDIGKNIIIDIIPHPTFDLSYKYTKEDGELLSAFADIFNNSKLGIPYKRSFKNILNDLYHIDNIFRYTCSSGKSSVAIDNNSIYLCHRLFTEPKDNETHISMELYKYKGFSYHHFNMLYLNTNLCLIKELADNGQILSEYKDINNALLLAIFIKAVMYCISEFLVLTTSEFLIPVSIILLLGNGYFEKIKGI